jgi:hypothetical protein
MTPEQLEKSKRRLLASKEKTPSFVALRYRCAEFDLNSPGAQRLLAIKEALLADLGGEETLSMQQKLLVDALVKDLFFITWVEDWLLTTRSKNDDRLIRMIEHRARLTDSLTYRIKALGLKKFTKQITLQDWVAERLKEKAQQPSMAMEPGPQEEEDAAE